MDLFQISQFEDIVHKQELEMAQLRQQKFDSENQMATANHNYKSLEANLDLYKQKCQSCINKLKELENTKQQLEVDLHGANKQVSCALLFALERLGYNCSHPIESNCFILEWSIFSH